uniref:Chloride channel CLIC-like protein 1 n=1 Tax=Anopheles epiroticus TaxID=199890 RepID=A0A182PGU1_9DIPT
MISISFRSVSLVCALFAVCHPIDCKQDAKWVKPGALDRWKEQQRKERYRESGDNPNCEAQAEAPFECNCPPPLEPPPPAPCSPDITEEQRLSLVFYRKLITTLFARDNLLTDPAAEDFLTTDLSLRISTRQLERLLDETSSARELNSIVAAVLEQASSTRRNTHYRENQCERLYMFLMQSFGSRIIDHLLPVLLLVTGCYIIRIISRVTHIHPFIAFLLLILSITVCNKWKECNENLARRSLRNMDSTSSSWTHIFGIRRNDVTSSLAICDPTKVLVESTVSIQAEYFRSIFKEFLDAYNKATQDLWFPQRMVVGLLMLGFAYVVIMSLLQVSVRSGFELFGTMVTSTMSRASGTAAPAAIGDGPQQQLPAINLSINIGDSTARSIALSEMLRQESQRIEDVATEEVLEAAPKEEAECLEAIAAPKKTSEEIISEVASKPQSEEK